jgi:DNA-binding CsgD family transcriptional regulator
MVQWDMALRGAKRPAAIVTFVDQQERREARIARLRRRFELTAAEADVAQAVMQGGCRADVAARLGITVATVRAHLSHIFVKVGVHRQAELVRRILQSDRDDS